MLESCAEVSVCRSVKVSGRALALRDAHLRSTHGAWRPGDGVRATPHRPHRFAAKICADLLSARDAGTCGASARTSCQTAFGRVDEDGVWLSTHRIGGSVPCRAERQEVHADIRGPKEVIWPVQACTKSEHLHAILLVSQVSHCKSLNVGHCTCKSLNVSPLYM